MIMLSFSPKLTQTPHLFHLLKYLLISNLSGALHRRDCLSFFVDDCSLYGPNLTFFHVLFLDPDESRDAGCRADFGRIFGVENSSVVFLTRVIRLCPMIGGDL